MARTLNRLKVKQVEALGAGRHSDGGGLYLDNDGHGRSRWLFMWKRDGRRREMGLGAAGRDGVSLSSARAAAEAARAIVRDGGDPIQAREALSKPPVATPTFGEVADTFVAALSPQWRNEKHRAQWSMTLKAYAGPLRAVPVDAVDTAAVLAVLQPLWLSKPETASRLRGRIERVLDAAKAKGHRAGENPACWRGHLDHLLPKRHKLSRGHHAALPYEHVASFIEALQGREAIAAYALEFLILTAARSAEVLGATWNEVDLDAGIWTVPAARMKSGREHRVPLSRRAVEVLYTVRPLAGTGAPETTSSAPLFPSARGGMLSTMAMAMLLRRMKMEVTVHGFRSSFRDWAGEVSIFPREVAEAALAHTVGDATERAYRRGDALEKRRTMMEAWAGFVRPVSATGTVVQLSRGPS